VEVRSDGSALWNVQVACYCNPTEPDLDLIICESRTLSELILMPPSPSQDGRLP
jgi:hypothetical protein